MKKILLHICCGPCATASVKKLQEDGLTVTGYYYNPNIHPDFEYTKRLAEAERLARQLKIKLIVPPYQPAEYFSSIRGTEENPSERCPRCWEQRLLGTARKARALGIETIGTTLRISPYQDQKALLELGRKIAAEHSLMFCEAELLSCFKDSIKMSKEQRMYRQKYCGCIFSREYR